MIGRGAAISYQTYRGYEADVDHWQQIIGPGSTATGYFAFTDVTPVPPAAHASPDVDFDPTVTDKKLSAIDTELKLAATWNVETSPVQATVSILGDQVDEVHSSIFDDLERCTCPSCLQERRPTITRDNSYGSAGFFLARCRIPPCTMAKSTYIWGLTPHASVLSPEDFSLYRLKDLYEHERIHFEHQGKYKCAEEDCGHLTKQFRDLKRHYRAKHCTKIPEFPCDALGCKFGGENGFHRRDKLASHYKNIHQGQAASIARPRNILPAPTRGRLSGPGTGSSSK